MQPKGKGKDWLVANYTVSWQEVTMFTIVDVKNDEGDDTFRLLQHPLLLTEVWRRMWFSSASYTKYLRA